MLRAHRFCKLGVGQGVLVGAVHRSRGWKGTELAQRRPHLLGAALKESAAAHGKKSIATKQGLGMEVADVIQRVSWRCNDSEIPSSYLHKIFIIERLIEILKWTLGWAINHGVGCMLAQLANTSDVVRMMMGDEDGREREALVLHVLQYWARITGVHNIQSLVVLPGPDVVILKGRQGRDGWCHVQTTQQNGDSLKLGQALCGLFPLSMHRRLRHAARN